jgi:chromosome partitioning protein
MNARVIAVANQKGGVAKTTTVVNLGAAIAAQGRRVLIVDLDAQANATTCLGVDPRRISAGAYEALVEDKPAREVIVQTERHDLDLLPASADLAGAEVELTQRLARERMLATALAPILPDYDYVLVDDPPSLGLLTINGLTASTDGVLIPVQCEYLALEGLSQLLRTVQKVRDVLNPKLHVMGVVLTMYDSRTNLAQQVVQEVRSHFPREVFRTVIPRNIRLSEAPSYGQPILAYAPTSAGALAYAALAQEFIERLEGDAQRAPQGSNATSSR